jgi:hypothetical protein
MRTHLAIHTTVERGDSDGEEGSQGREEEGGEEALDAQVSSPEADLKVGLYARRAASRERLT